MSKKLTRKYLRKKYNANGIIIYNGIRKVNIWITQVGIWIPSGMWVFTWLKKIYTARTQFFFFSMQNKGHKTVSIWNKEWRQEPCNSTNTYCSFQWRHSGFKQPTPVKTTELFKIGNKEWQTGKQLASKTFRNNKTKM